MSLFYVTLIDAKGTESVPLFSCANNFLDSFEYTPHIVDKIVNPETCTSSLRFTHDSYVKNGRVIIGYAKDIIDDGKCVVVNGEKVCKKITFFINSPYFSKKGLL